MDPFKTSDYSISIRQAHSLYHFLQIRKSWYNNYRIIMWHIMITYLAFLRDFKCSWWILRTVK